MPTTGTIPIVTVVDDDLITADLWMDEFQNISNLMVPSGIDDYSASNGEMQTETDPYPGDVVSRPTSLQGELERLRFQVNQIIGKTYWYQDPTLSLEALKEAFVLTGEIRAYAGDSAPSGWLLCDGSAVSRTTYDDLFALVGERFGQGDNVTTFNIPDYRGQFLRGRDGGVARDPNAASRTAMATGGATGDAVGSIQADATSLPTTSFTTDDPGNHNHENGSNTLLMRKSGSNTPASLDSSGSEIDVVNTAEIQPSGSHTHTVTGGGDSETRPTNSYVNYLIKY